MKDCKELRNIWYLLDRIVVHFLKRFILYYSTMQYSSIHETFHC
ncbi:unnamed protein product [Brugia pahangi]|uniref:Uncharacterized protein n=1 Tax=Brugia pahangi TaxID=6280 RepID=A0A0N4TR83_BRUPA|nr:unnamed protein product [Brugia pahangi]